MNAFCQWLASTSGSIALHESLYMYPLVESVHVLTLCVFVGLAAILDLRLMGITLRRIPVSEVARRLLPWMGFGFTIMVITGVMLFYAIPIRSFHSVWFRMKLVLLVLAGLNAWLFHARIWRTVSEWDLEPIPPTAARVADPKPRGAASGPSSARPLLLVNCANAPSGPADHRRPAGRDHE